MCSGQVFQSGTAPAKDAGLPPVAGQISRIGAKGMIMGEFVQPVPAVWGFVAKKESSFVATCLVTGVAGFVPLAALRGA